MFQCKIYLLNVPGNIYDALCISDENDSINGVEVDRFLDLFSSSDSENVLEIGELGHDSAFGIVKAWLDRKSRELNNHQVDIKSIKI